MKTAEEVLSYLKTRREELMEQLNQLDENIEHLSGTIEMLEKEAIAKPIGATKMILTGPEFDSFPIGRLRGLTQLQAVIAIARHFGGTVRAQDAKRLMIDAGVMRNTKNSTNITHNVITRSKMFDRVGPGEYRLRVLSETPEGEEFIAAPVQ